MSDSKRNEGEDEYSRARISNEKKRQKKKAKLKKNANTAKEMKEERN